MSISHVFSDAGRHTAGPRGLRRAEGAEGFTVKPKGECRWEWTPPSDRELSPLHLDGLWLLASPECKLTHRSSLCPDVLVSADTHLGASVSLSKQAGLEGLRLIRSIQLPLKRQGNHRPQNGAITTCPHQASSFPIC